MMQESNDANLGIDHTYSDCTWPCRCSPIQRSEGGGLGIGGGGSGGGFMTARGTANLMTRVTTVLAAGFFTTSIILAIMAGAGNETVSIVDDVINSTPAPVSGPAVPTDK